MWKILLKRPRTQSARNGNAPYPSSSSSSNSFLPHSPLWEEERERIPAELIVVGICRVICLSRNIICPFMGTGEARQVEPSRGVMRLWSRARSIAVLQIGATSSNWNMLWGCENLSRLKVENEVEIKITVTLNIDG